MKLAASDNVLYSVEDAERKDLAYMVENSCISCNRLLERAEVKIVPPRYVQERDEYVRRGAVSRDYGRKGQSLIEKMDVKEASIMLRNLEEGSMRPKVEACVRFVRATGKIAGIGNISHPEKVFSLRCLTLITH